MKFFAGVGLLVLQIDKFPTLLSMILLRLMSGLDIDNLRQGALHRNTGYDDRNFRYMSSGSARVSETVCQLAEKHRSVANNQRMSGGNLHCAVPIHAIPDPLRPYGVN